MAVGSGGPGSPSAKGTSKLEAGGGTGVNLVSSQPTGGSLQEARGTEGTAVKRQFPKGHSGLRDGKEIQF